MRMRRLLCAILLFSGIFPAWAGPPAIEMPDVRANVLKLLQEGKAQGTAMVVEEEYSTYSPSTTTQPAVTSPRTSTEASSGDEDLFSQALEQEQGNGDDVVDASSLTPEQAQEVVVPAPAQRRRNDDHVPLPNKVITIQDLQDLRQLHDEFEQAKKHQQGK